MTRVNKRIRIKIPKLIARWRLRTTHRIAISGSKKPSMEQPKRDFTEDEAAMEIQRFESVHPSIYAIYDLIELVPDPLLAQQIREHVVCIEGKIILAPYKSFCSI